MSARRAATARCTAFAVSLAGVTALSGCFPSGPDFAPPRRIAGVRVVAVTAEPASGVPGAPVELRIEAFDSRQHPIASEGAPDAGRATAEDVEPLTIAWLGGCHNPPGDVHFGCYPLLQRIAAGLPSPLPLSAADVPASAREFFGLGSSFWTTIPSDVLVGRALETDALPFGVSFAFFAVCRGRLFPAPEAEGVPLRCEAANGEPVAAEGFVRGFSTVYTYSGSINRAPIISAKVTGGFELDEPQCNSDADCRGLENEFFGSVCRDISTVRIAGESGEAPRRCLPSVPRCIAPPCAEYELWPRLADGSVEADPAAAPRGGSPPDEILWVKYYGLGGVLEGQVLVNDRATGLSSNYATRWVPPGRASETPLPVWAVVQDNRGGASVARWDFAVTE